MIVTAVYSGVMTLIILMVIRTVMGLRVDPRVEYWGLDFAHHGETIVEYEEALPKKIPTVLKQAKAKKPPTKLAKKPTAKKKKT